MTKDFSVMKIQQNLVKRSFTILTSRNVFYIILGIYNGQKEKEKKRAIMSLNGCGQSIISSKSQGESLKAIKSAASRSLNDPI